MQTQFHLVQTFGGVRTCLFIPLVDPTAKRWGPMWCGIEALDKLRTRALRDGKRCSDTICVWHFGILYYESKSSRSDTISTSFVLFWAHQENSSNSQSVCVGLA